jgi:hypothetical protein
MVLGEFPGEVMAIPIGQKAYRLHFLHGPVTRRISSANWSGVIASIFPTGRKKRSMFYIRQHPNKVRSVVD